MNFVFFAFIIFILDLRLKYILLINEFSFIVYSSVLTMLSFCTHTGFRSCCDYIKNFKNCVTMPFPDPIRISPKVWKRRYTCG